MSRSYILGGSPLGLMNMQARPNRDGVSTFNGGDSRNVDINKYNSGKKQGTNINIDGKSPMASVSLFTGGTITNFWGNIGGYGQDIDRSGLKSKYKGINRAELHNDVVYDTSLLNIMEKLSYSPRTSLRPQDFVYLKHLGVYPNNRLMIARKFTEPQSDNIMSKGGTAPISVLISWKPEDEDFLEFSFGEKWDDANADFTDVLNSFGEKFGSGGSIKGLGKGLGKGLNALPLPGVTETLQRQVLASLGILNPDGNEPLPAGNPNIIKMAKRRRTIGYSEAGSGLEAKISIKMSVEYEMKFISGIDPTVVWMDVISNVLAFGTQNSQSYGLSGNFVDKLNEWTQRGGTVKFTNHIVTKLKEGINNSLGYIQSMVGDLRNKRDVITKDLTDGQKSVNMLESFLSTSEKKVTFGEGNGIAGAIIDKVIESIDKTIELYRLEVMGIGHALSGLPSTPWHITLGNPLRPVFCSGDMLTTDVSVKLGNQLSFNDLPTSIKVEFTLTNARPLGMQEIISKFNSGYLRVVNPRKDFTVGGKGDYYNKIDMTGAVGIKKNDGVETTSVSSNLKTSVESESGSGSVSKVDDLTNGVVNETTKGSNILTSGVDKSGTEPLTGNN